MQFNESFERRFWAKVKKTDTCWLWTASKKNGSSYGQISWNSAGGMIKAHRASYILHFGPIEAGKLICHKCDIPSCVNPNHLFVGSHLDNHADRNAKGRQAFGERSGSTKLTSEAVQLIRSEYLAGGTSTIKLAAKFGVSQPSINAIILFKTWKHIKTKENK